MVVDSLKRVEWAEIDTDIGINMFLADFAEFGRKVKLNKPNDTTSYVTRNLTEARSKTVPNGFTGNYYYDTPKGSRTGVVVNKQGRAYNLPRIESQNGIDTVYGGLGGNKYLKQLNKQARPIRSVRKRGDKTYRNTSKITQTIDTNPVEQTTKYVPKKFSDINTTPRQTVNTSSTTTNPKPQKQTSNPRVDKPQTSTSSAQAKTTRSNQPPRQTINPTTGTAKTTTPSTPKPSGKKSSKLLNKYSLGALGVAGVLGAGYVGYRAYQKRKKEDRK